MKVKEFDESLNINKKKRSIQPIVTYCWHSGIEQKLVNGKIIEMNKIYLHRDGMDFDKVLSLFNQESFLTFQFLTCFDIKKDTYVYNITNVKKNVAFGFLEGYKVFVWENNIGELRKFLKENYITLSKFYFITDNGICCYNNQNRFRELEIDLEIPIELNINFFKRVALIDKSLAKILKVLHKFPKCYLSFRNENLIAIFPNVNKNNNSEFSKQYSYLLSIIVSFVEYLR